MIQPKQKPKTKTITVAIAEDDLGALDAYCQFLGGATDRAYVITQALREVITRDRRFREAQAKPAPAKAEAKAEKAARA